MAWLHAVIDAPADQHAGLGEFWSGPSAGRSATVARPSRAAELRAGRRPPTSTSSGSAAHPGCTSTSRATTRPPPSTRARGSGGRAGRRAGALAAMRRRAASPSAWSRATSAGAPGPSPGPPATAADWCRCASTRPRRHEAEVAFWRALLRGRWVDSPATEFAGKWHDDAGSPLQLLFQRTEDDHGTWRHTSTSAPTTSARRCAPRRARRHRGRPGSRLARDVRPDRHGVLRHGQLAGADPFARAGLALPPWLRPLGPRVRRHLGTATSSPLAGSASRAPRAAAAAAGRRRRARAPTVRPATVRGWSATPGRARRW